MSFHVLGVDSTKEESNLTANLDSWALVTGSISSPRQNQKESDDKTISNRCLDGLQISPTSSTLDEGCREISRDFDVLSPERVFLGPSFRAFGTNV